MFVDEKAAGEAQEQQQRITKLSQAIREGARLRPQGFCGVLGQMERGESCALLAAYEAIEGWPNAGFNSNSLAVWVQTKWPDLGNVRSHIVGKNDAEQWTREEIAGWLESQDY